MIDAIAKAFFPSAPRWKAKLRIGVLIAVVVTLAACAALLAVGLSPPPILLVCLLVVYGVVWFFVDIIP